MNDDAVTKIKKPKLRKKTVTMTSLYYTDNCKEVLDK
jgi:hypothetical protein